MPGTWMNKHAIHVLIVLCYATAVMIPVYGSVKSMGEADLQSKIILFRPGQANHIFDPGFESGKLDACHWIASPVNNPGFYRSEVVPDKGYHGSYGLATRSQGYTRLGQYVPFEDKRFRYSFRFYVNVSDDGCSVWGSVLSGKDLDDITAMRSVGYNHKSSRGTFQCQYDKNYRNMAPILSKSGWYKGVISYEDPVMTFEIYDDSGVSIAKKAISDPGFKPVAVSINVGSTFYYVDDLEYLTGYN